MPMDPLPIWVKEIAALSNQSGKDGAWADKLADVVDKRVTNKLQISLITGSVTYTFNKSLFATLLKLDKAVPIAPPAVSAIASAWEGAALASTIVVSPGSFTVAPAPPTLYSVVMATIILPPSVEIGKALLTQMLLASTPVPVALASKLGPALFAAFSALQAMVTGLNSLPPPPAGPGPLPLIVPAAPVI